MNHSQRSSPTGHSTPTLRTQRAGILSIGTSLPQHSIAQADAALLACELGITQRWQRALPTLYRSSGVDTRHSVLLENASRPEGDSLLENETPQQSEKTPNSRPDDSSSNESGASVATKVRSAVVQRQSFYPFAVDAPLGPTTRDRMQAYEEHAGELASRASLLALERSGKSSSEISHLITVSCSGFLAPGVDLHLIQSLELNPEVQRTHVGFMGCHGALNAIRVAKSIVEADPKAVVLLCAIELCSLHQQYTEDPQQLVANSLFADGSAAMVLACESRISDWHVEATGSMVIPDTNDLMSWKIGDHGFEMSLSPKVPITVEEQLRPWLTRFLARHQTTIDAIEAWAIHPGGPRILTACKTALSLSDAQMEWSQQVLARYGNMSSPTVLFILQNVSLQSQAKLCLMLAFGPGLCIEATLLRRG